MDNGVRNKKFKDRDIVKFINVEEDKLGIIVDSSSYTFLYKVKILMCSDLTQIGNIRIKHKDNLELFE